MAATEDLLCSEAMELLGHTPFTTFESTDDKHHKTAERLWPTVRDKILARHPWNCAIKRVLLATPDGTAPVFDWSYRFPLPADWLRTLSVGTDLCKPRYRIEGGFILIDAIEVPLRYIAKITDTTKYEPHLTEAMVYAMAARMAYQVTGSTSKSDEMQAMAERKVIEAIAIDSAEEDGEVLGYNSPLLDSRFE